MNCTNNLGWDLAPSTIDLAHIIAILAGPSISKFLIECDDSDGRGCCRAPTTMLIYSFLSKKFILMPLER